MKIFAFTGHHCSGKSSLSKMLSKEIPSILLEKDLLQNAFNQSNGNNSSTEAGYIAMFDILRSNSQNQFPVILDAIFPKIEYRNVVNEIAIESGYELQWIHTCCSNTPIWKSRIENRKNNLRHLNLYCPSMEEIQEAHQKYQPWDSHSNVLCIDTSDPIENNFADLVNKLNNSCSRTQKLQSRSLELSQSQESLLPYLPFLEFKGIIRSE